MVTTLWSALTVGAIYVLTALGYNIVWLTAGVFNFAQAQFVMVGTFVAFASVEELHVAIPVGFLLGVAVGFSLGAVEERLAMRPIAGKGAHGELVTTVGAALALDGLAEVIWGSQPRSVPFFGPTHGVTLAGGRVLPDQVLIIGLAIALSAALMAWSRWSLTGNVSLAAAEDRQAAMLRGVNIRRFTLLAVAVAGGVAGLLGLVIAPDTYAVYNLGDSLVAYAFLALTIGGFGSYGGALVGGLVAGVVQSFAEYFWNSNVSGLVMLLLLLVVLAIRPTGIFGARKLRTA